MIKILFCFLSFISFNCFPQNDSKVQIDDELIVCFPQVDSLPEIIGGIESLESKIFYPPNALEYKVEGNVYVQINIDLLGNPSKPVLVKGIGMGCNEEAIDVILKSKFTPAYSKGKPVNYQITVRVKFRLPKGTN